MKIKILTFLMLFGALSFGQAYRFDSTAFGSQGFQGVLAAKIMPGATVSVCTYPATFVAGTCTPLATTYTDSTGSTACNGTNGCSNPTTSNSYGNFGFWANAGHYQYIVSVNGALYGPWDVTLGGGSAFQGGTVPNPTTFSSATTFSAGFNLVPLTVATLPASPTTGQIENVGDGVTTSDCTVGGGSQQSTCKYNGTTWVPVGGSGGGGFNTSATAATPTIGTADATGATSSTTALQNSIAAVATSAGQRMYIPSGIYLVGSSTVLHFDREMVVDGAGSGEDTPATTIQLGPKSYAVIDRAATSPDGGRGDWTRIDNIRFLGTFMTCTATATSATLSSCNQNPATFLSLNANDPIVVMGSNGAPWVLFVPQGTTASSMTSNSITMSANSSVSGTATVMAGGPLVGTGTTTSSSTSITGVTNCSSWAPGDPIFGAGISYPNFLTGVNCGTNTLTLFTAAGAGAGAGNLYKSPLPNLIVKATPRLYNVSCGYSAGHCIDINASASYTPSTIADGWSADSIRVAHTGGLAFHCQGADCNAGKAQGLYMAYGAEGGYRSDSFLGGTILGGEVANNGGPGWNTTNINASEVLINPYQESGYQMPSYAGNTLVLGGNSSSHAAGSGNVLTSSGQFSPGFFVQNATGSTGNTTNGSTSVTNVTNITQWNVGDTIFGQSTCIPASATIAATDGVSVLTLSANATCTQTGLSFNHTGMRTVLGSLSSLDAAGGFGVSLNQSIWFYYENQYRDYYATNNWGWVCGYWRNFTGGLCYSTDWAVGKEVPPNSSAGAYGNNGGRIKFPNGFYIGDGAASDYMGTATGSAAPTTGSWSQGSWSFPQSPAVTGSAGAWIQIGVGKSYSTSVTANTTLGSTTISTTSTNFNNSCAPNDWITGTGIENDTIIFSVNTGASTAVLSRPASATGTTIALTCGRVAKAHPATTGNTNTSTSITSVSPTSSFANGDMITGTGIPANTYVVSGGGTATLTISQAATSTNTGVTLTDPTTAWVAVPFTLGSGQIALSTGAIAASACTNNTVTLTGAATTDNIDLTFASDPSAVTGYSGSAILTIYKFATANTVNIKQCNWTASSITPAALSINWSVRRP